jgi:LPXTG-motif cell wall-anchored protein
VRNPVRKFVGVALMGVIGALFALPLAAAGAQTVPGEGAPPTPDCVILSVAPNPTPFPATITVTGTVSSAVHLTLYATTPPLTGTKVAIANQDVAAGNFSISGEVTAESDISLGITFGNENAYTGACATPGGEVVVRVKSATASKPAAAPAAAAKALAFTGSSETPSYVLIGIAALVVGAVLVVAARRRSDLS